MEKAVRKDRLFLLSARAGWLLSLGSGPPTLPGVTSIPPAWTHLQPDSLKALLEPPGRVPQALRLTPYNVPIEAALQVPMVVAARLLLKLAVEKGGLVLTPAGALKRADVWHVFDRTEWPGYDKATTLAMNKVINEDDAYGVLFTRIVLQAAGLLRKRLGVLKATKAGKTLLVSEAAPALLAELFEAVFWKVNLQDFDRNPIEFWPQHHMGVVLWSLSVTAHGWSNAGQLMLACTIMETLDKVPRPDLPEFAMMSRVLRPLAWLGVFESRKQTRHSRREFDEDFRKAPLFGQLVSFEVKMKGAGEARH
ncbi:hypothetical protein QO058_04515 [Bosea vestrisii]|uniref:hypothetical protein n=1 Tax=Bosea vestrisii TaxID=151416 RepID=UPI0024DFA82F|nr:hypothetical protein [Bosea vestrisii]WID97536.1 hypothetical protein QO058_04515 [Bosea vestrisii]